MAMEANLHLTGVPIAMTQVDVVLTVLSPAGNRSQLINWDQIEGNKELKGRFAEYPSHTPKKEGGES
jgi:hypothetical protein